MVKDKKITKKRTYTSYYLPKDARNYVTNYQFVVIITNMMERWGGGWGMTERGGVVKDKKITKKRTYTSYYLPKDARNYVNNYHFFVIITNMMKRRGRGLGYEGEGRSGFWYGE